MRIERFCYGLAWTTLFIAAFSLIHRVVLNSDTLFLDALTRDVFNGAGLWADWRPTPAPAYVPDMLLYFLGYKLFSSAVLRVFFVSFCQVFILTGLSLWLTKKIQPSLSLMAKSSIVLVIAFITLVASHSGMWLYFYTANNHFAALVFALLILGWLFAFIEKPSLWLGIVIIITAGLAKASSEVFIIGFAAPVIATCLLASFIIRKELSLRCYQWRIVGIIGLFITSFGLAHVIDWFLTYHSPLNGRVPMSVTAAGNSFVLFLTSLKMAFTPDNIYTFLLALFILFTFLMLIMRLIFNVQLRLTANNNAVLALPMTDKNVINWKFNGCCLLLTLTVPINLLGAIGSGGFVDIAGARYFTIPIALAILLFIIILDDYRNKSHNITRITQSAFIIASLALFAVALHTAKQFFYEQSLTTVISAQLHQDNGETAIANCLQQLIAQKTSLNAGVADYWFARGVSIRTSFNIPIEATLNDLTPFFWMSTVGPYLHPQRYAPRKYNFVIIRDGDEDVPFGYNAETLNKILPKGYKIFSCANTNNKIWFYPNDKLDILVKAKQGQLISAREFQKPRGFCKVIHRC